MGVEERGGSWRCVGEAFVFVVVEEGEGYGFLWSSGEVSAM